MWGSSTANVSPTGPVDSAGDHPWPKGRGNRMDPHHLSRYWRLHGDAWRGPSLPAFHKEGYRTLTRFCSAWVSSVFKTFRPPGFRASSVQDAFRLPPPRILFDTSTGGTDPAAHIEMCLLDSEIMARAEKTWASWPATRQTTLVETQGASSLDKHFTPRMFFSAFTHCALARMFVFAPQHSF